MIDAGHYGQARKIIEPLLAENPKDFVPAWSYSRLLLVLDRKEEFLLLSRRLEQDYPQEKARIYLDRAAFYAQGGQKDAEYDLLRQAWLHNPQNLETRRRIGQWLYRERKWDQAETHFQAMVREKVLLAESYLRLGMIRERLGRGDQAAEYFWKALAEDPDSVESRVRLLHLPGSGPGRRFRAQAEQTLRQYARSQDAGLLAWADIEAEENNREKAESLYGEILEVGEDDEVIKAARQKARRDIERQRYEATELFLEDLQKRFPRNQRITRDLILTYSLNKSYGEAIKLIDGLLKIEDPLDPVLITKKARLLERWNKHGASQKVLSALLIPAVDQILWDRLQDWPGRPKPLELEPLKDLAEQRDPQSLYAFYDRLARRLAEASLEPETRGRLGRLLQDLEAKALI